MGFCASVGKKEGLCSIIFPHILLNLKMLPMGVIIGSFGYALFSHSLRFEWFQSWDDFIRHIVGGALMGIGGVLAMGCTIGQGITGMSSLALGSLLALTSIILGCATTMKIQLYRMVYEDASWLDALITGCVDLHLLPGSLRRLEAV